MIDSQVGKVPIPSAERARADTFSAESTKEPQFVKVTPEAVLSPNPVQALADKRELDYLNSVRKYQIDIAAREQNYLESVQQQQQAAVQREDAYTEMVLTVAAQLQQETEKREAAYVAAVMTAARKAKASETTKEITKTGEVIIKLQPDKGKIGG